MKVSVCTSVLNQSNYLKRMIESVIAQTFQNWELIIVDDGSTEDIGTMVADFKDDRILFERFAENKGIPHGMNRAFSLARGEYIQPLSADEWIWEKKFEVQVPWMDDHPGIGCSWGLPTPNVGQKWELGECKEWEQYKYKAHNRSREAWIRTLLRLENIPIGGASMLMRRSCYEDIGGFDPQFFDVSDLEWFVRFFQKYQGWVLPYRFADAEHPETRLTGPSDSREPRFQDNMKRLHEKHKIVLPPVEGRITITVPVYNMEKFIAPCLNSILAQTFVDFDVVVLDDASTDGTLAEIQKFTDPRIKLLQFDENRGCAAAQNHMLAVTETEFIVPFSADDVLDPTFLERCLAEFKRDPFLEMVASQTDFIDVEGKNIDGPHPFKTIPKVVNKSREDWLNQLYYGNHYFGAGMFRTYALKEIGGWDTTVGAICDYEMYVKLLQRENIHIIEEDLTHTRCHDKQQSLMDTKPKQLKLRRDYHSIKRRFYPPRMKVIVATPFYEMKGFVPYISSLVGTTSLMTRLNIENEFWELSGDSYIDRAKNTLMNKFLEDPDATDLFMIDADMQWNPVSFMNILSLPEEIVMGSYPQKNGWDKWTAIPLLVTSEDGQPHPVGRVLQDGSALIKAAFLAGGFIRLKRSAIEKYAEKYADLNYHDMGADPSYPDRKYIEFFTCERASGDGGKNLRWGEDRVFGKRMAAIGVEGWIFPNADIGHYGVKGWQGNYHSFIKNGTPAQ